MQFRRGASFWGSSSPPPALGGLCCENGESGERRPGDAAARGERLFSLPAHRPAPRLGERIEIEALYGIVGPSPSLT